MFETEYLQLPCPLTEEQKRAIKAVREYDRRCDSFDRLMTRQPAGEVHPAYRSLMSRNARETRRDVIREFDVTEEAFQSALRISRDRRPEKHPGPPHLGGA